jgi:hypothetical protein
MRLVERPRAQEIEQRHLRTCQDHIGHPALTFRHMCKSCLLDFSIVAVGMHLTQSVMMASHRSQTTPLIQG